MVRVRENPNIRQFVEANALTAICFWAERDELVDDFGFPRDLSALQAKEDAAIAQLTAAGVAAFHTASVTGEGQRVVYFGHASDIALPFDMGALSMPGFEVRLLSVENREAYLGLVTPTQLDLKLNGDQGVIANLEKHGDLGATPRKTDFWFYGERERLQGLASELEGLGYMLDHWIEEPIGIVLTKVTAVDFGAFREISPELLAAANRRGVEYDGWETFVLKQGSPEPELTSAAEPKSFLSKLFGAKKN